MQASRNPDPLSNDFALGFDTCFSVGRAGFEMTFAVIEMSGPSKELKTVRASLRAGFGCPNNCS